MEKNLKTGTTILGFTYKDGVILAADRKVTLGSLNINNLQKVFPIIGKIYLAHAGSVSDNQYLLKILRAEARLKELETRRPVLIDELAHLASMISFNNKNPFTGGYEVILILGGVDAEGPKLFDVWGDGATVQHKKYVTNGSGSYLIHNLFDELYKENMTREEAEAFAKQLIQAAARRDVLSGNGVDIFIIPKDGDVEHHVEQFPHQLPPT